MEKFISFSCQVNGSDWRLDFKDSLSFLLAPLDKLTKNLKAKAMQDMKNPSDSQTFDKYFPNTSNFFATKYSHLDKKHLQLLLRKGVFPYDYIKSLDTLEETEFPTHDDFYNILTQEPVSWPDYEHGKKVCIH